MKQKPSKDIRKSLQEPDVFVSRTSQLINYIYTNRKPILIGLAVLLIVVAGVFGYQWRRVQMEKNASQRLAEIMNRYREAVSAAEGDEEKAFENIRSDLKSLVETAASTRTGKIARVRFANLLYRAGEIKRAAELYRNAISDFQNEPEIRVFIESGLAHALQAQGEIDEAVSRFEAVLAFPGDVLDEDALFQLGELYAASGKTEKSEQAFRELLTRFADSMYTDLVKTKLGMTGESAPG